MSKGKNYSTNNASGERRKGDFYETPYSITQHLLDNEFFKKDAILLEPACGEGAIVKVLKDNGFNPFASDLTEGVDFLESGDNETCNYIITNPPFSKAYEFTLQAKKVCRNKFAFLLPLNYLHGKQRYDNIYQDKNFPLARVYILTRYPMLGETLREDGKYTTGMMVYVWDLFYTGDPIIKWIDNHADIHSDGKEKREKEEEIIIRMEF